LAILQNLVSRFERELIEKKFGATWCCPAQSHAEILIVCGVDQLILVDTDISGTIPTELGLCTALSKSNRKEQAPIPLMVILTLSIASGDFIITRAVGLSGQLPSELGNLTNLRECITFNSQIDLL
jgi:hypothetical protein